MTRDMAIDWLQGLLAVTEDWHSRMPLIKACLNEMLKRAIAGDTSLFLSAYKSDVLNRESICNQSGA